MAQSIGSEVVTSSVVCSEGVGGAVAVSAMVVEGGAWLVVGGAWLVVGGI